MYKAKENGKNNFCFFNESMFSEMLENTQKENNLRKALDAGELMVYYQPQADTYSGKICSMEALVRWKCGGRMIPPMEFIPLAEKTRLIVPLGNFVLREACRQNRKWQELGCGEFVVWVNISTIELRQDEFVDTIMNILDETGLEPCFLGIEITESVIMVDFESINQTLVKLRELGVRMSLDDFGTGYSSLKYLSRLPINIIKIDKSFVDDITKDPSRKAIIQSIVNLSHKMGLLVTAEGAETREQLDFLARLHCDMIQGYYICKALPAGEATLMLEQGIDRQKPAGF